MSSAISSGGGGVRSGEAALFFTDFAFGVDLALGVAFDFDLDLDLGVGGGGDGEKSSMSARGRLF